MYVDKRGKNGERKKLDKEIPVSNISDENLYCLNGRVPLKKAIPFGLQHVCAMFAAGLGTIMQLYPV